MVAMTVPRATVRRGIPVSVVTAGILSLCANDEGVRERRPGEPPWHGFVFHHTNYVQPPIALSPSERAEVRRGAGIVTRSVSPIGFRKRNGRHAFGRPA